LATPDRQQSITLALVLGATALSALFFASGTTRLVASRLFPLEGTPLPPTARTGEAEPAVPSAAARRKDPTRILRRNIFDSQSGPQDGERVVQGPQEGADETGVDEPPPADDPTRPPPPCEGSIRLVGSFHHPQRPESSFAAITNTAGKVLLYRTGGTVDGRSVEVIGSSVVYLRNASGALCSIAMFRKPEELAAASAAAPATPPPLPEPFAEMEPVGGIPAAELEAGITKVSETEFRLQRGLVDRILTNQAELMRQARVVPHEEGGRVVGVKLYGIRRNSLLGRLGLQNGDVLRTINGFDMTSPDKALEAYTRLRDANQLTVNVMRRNAPTNINYTIQ
jgi:general secretion pathway protein C